VGWNRSEAQQRRPLDRQIHAFRRSEWITRLVDIIAMLCALGGCLFIQPKVEMDASTAAMIAANSGDAAGAACFKALEPVVGSFSASSKWPARARSSSRRTGRARRLRPDCSCICHTKSRELSLTDRPERPSHLFFACKNRSCVGSMRPGKGRIRGRRPARWRGAARFRRTPVLLS
jgi:hypothetical protein